MSRSEHMAEQYRVEKVIREALPGLLCDEYGQTEAEWRELRSVQRIARALAEQVTRPSKTGGDQ